MLARPKFSFRISSFLSTSFDCAISFSLFYLLTSNTSEIASPFSSSFIVNAVVRHETLLSSFLSAFLRIASFCSVSHHSHFLSLPAPLRGVCFHSTYIRISILLNSFFHELTWISFILLYKSIPSCMIGFVILSPLLLFFFPCFLDSFWNSVPLLIYAILPHTIFPIFLLFQKRKPKHH